MCHQPREPGAADQAFHRPRELGVLLRQPGERHEGGRHARAPERLIARPREAPATRVLAGDVGHDALGERGGVLRGVEHGVVGRAPRAGRVDVEVHDAALVQLAPGVVRVPGRAGVAPVRVAGPEREADAAPERVATAREQTRDLQHGRVGGAVVHGTVVPGVHVAGEQEKAILPASGQLADQVRDGHPPGAHARRHPQPQRPPRQQRAEPGTVGSQDRQARRLGDAPRGVRRRRPPDRCHDHVVQVIHEHVDVTQRPGLLQRPRPSRRGQPAHQRDLAGRPRQVLRPRVADVHDLGVQRLDRGRERVREALDDGAVGQGEARVLWQADVGLDLPPVDRQPVGGERALDVVERLGLARAAGFALQRPDRADVRHQVGGRDLGGQLGFERIAVLPGRRHRITSSRRCRMMRRSSQSVNARR